jgi:predicted transcriptional regulator
MRCDEIMKRDVESLREEDSVQTAAQRMRDMTVGFVPVCDPQAGRWGL